MDDIMNLLGASQLENANREVSKHLLFTSLGKEYRNGRSNLHQTARLLELAALDELGEEVDGAGVQLNNPPREFGKSAREIFEKAFQVHRVLLLPPERREAALQVLRIACFGVLGDRGTDAAQYISNTDLPQVQSVNPEDWGDRVFYTIIVIWLLLIRKNGWKDLTEVQNLVKTLREQQSEYEERYLKENDPGPSIAFRLIALYHLSKAAEHLAKFLTQGEIDGDYQPRQRLQAQFDRARSASRKGNDPDVEPLCGLLEHTAYQMVRNSIWTVTRGSGPRQMEFVSELTRQVTGQRPIFEMLPPQRAVLKEQGLMSSGRRSMVVSLPTSSGKTLIAQFRMLQALNQFAVQRGWVAYVAPNRALVNQVCAKLRKRFKGLGIHVERVSPALEIDQVEANLLTVSDEENEFDVLVTTPEKLNLMLRQDWESEIGRPLSLVVVDEAHNMSEGVRGLRLELLLATINRECRDAHFLLLTPFINNAAEVARWLDHDDYQDFQLSMEWKPNDRVIALSRQEQAAGRGAYTLDLETVHTNKDTLDFGGKVELSDDRPLGLSWSKVKGSKSNLAAVTAQVLKKRGPIIVLAGQKRWVWSLARKFKSEENKRASTHDDVLFVQRYLREEFGEGFELIELLDYEVAVHHAGLSDGARRLMEWLFERGRIKVLVATTTIAQGVNFPVSGVVLAHNKYFSKAGAEDMPAPDFWNLAGRAGRVNQDSVGIVALSAPTEDDAADLRRFVTERVVDLDSTLIKMVREALDVWSRDGIKALFWKPEWSSFLQYLVHSYRQMHDASETSIEIEQVLRGTFGYQNLRQEDSELAAQLLDAVNAYTAHLEGPLKMVDQTGFSLESIKATMGRVTEASIGLSSWREEGLFSQGDERLQSMMGVLLRVPELRDNLTEVLGGEGPDGDLLARMIKDWVKGKSITEMASDYYLEDEPTDKNLTEAISKCCSRLFGNLTQTTAWGLSALQSMSIRDFDSITDEAKEELRRLPSYVFYGVDNSQAMVLRSLGVPRKAAPDLALSMDGDLERRPLPEVREQLTNYPEDHWQEVLGDRGSDYYRAWRIFEGLEPSV